MPELFIESDTDTRHTDDMQDIITAVPSWILRWGITLFLVVIVMTLSLSAVISYPDIVKTSIKIVSPNAPKPIVSKVSGKLIKILMADNATIHAGQSLGYVESTANHAMVLDLLSKIQQIQKLVLLDQPVPNTILKDNNISELGELQTAYQSFYQGLLNYHSAIDNGFFLRKKNYLQLDLITLNQQRVQLNAQREIQERDFDLAGQEYNMHQKLAHEKVETSAELRQQESKYLMKKTPLIQTGTALITADGNYAEKQKEILELDNQISEAKSKFLQALNSLISQATDWKSKYVLSASQNGKLVYAGLLQENQVVSVNQEIFYVNSGDEHFFGQMSIPQNNMGKVKQGQEVLIKLKSYPFEQYGMIRGRITAISDVPYRDSIFISTVNFNINGVTDMKKAIQLRQGMLADAEIITQEATIFQRLTWNLLKLKNQ